jgi:hypothetical protein
MQRYDVWLETSWPCIYDDLIAEGLKVLKKRTSLRTQVKNAARPSEIVKFSHATPPPGTRSIQMSYATRAIHSTPSRTVLEAMCVQVGCDFATADFRLPVPSSWITPQIDSINRSRKPLMIYRPLTVRPEYSPVSVRNADPTQYAELLAEIRDNFFIASVADLVPEKEWIVGLQLKADMTFNGGELAFEQLAALFSQADLIFTSSGFAAVLGPAVGTPTVSIIGGHEPLSCHDAGARFAPYLAIGPARRPDKHLDMPTAKTRLRKFVSEICIQTSDTSAPVISETFTTAIPVPSQPAMSPQLLQLQRAMFHNRRGKT